MSEYGEIVYREIEKTRLLYNNVSIDHFIVMPIHVHMLIAIKTDDTHAHKENDAPRASRPTAALIPRIVAVIKRKTNQTYGFQMWQASFHDHIIRSKAEYQHIWQYIDENQKHWQEDCFYVKNT